MKYKHMRDVPKGAEIQGPEDDYPPIGWYDWHTATGAEVPHVAVYRHEGEGDETRILDVYMNNDVSVAEAEALAIRIVHMLNERDHGRTS